MINEADTSKKTCQACPSNYFSSISDATCVKVNEMYKL